MTQHELGAYLVSWREGLCTHLTTNPDGLLQKCYPKLARHISSHFPNIETLYLYARPVISPLHSVSRSDWVVRDINVRQLAQLCERCFSWGTLVGISKTFIKVVWNGVAFRQLLQVCHAC